MGYKVKRSLPKVLRRRGISPVISTVILTSILLTIVGVTIFYATSLIDANRQQMEFESSKDMLVYAATALEQVALGTGGSRYVRFSLSTTGIDFISNAFGELSVKIGNTEILRDRETSAIVITGGPLVTSTFRMLRPEIERSPRSEVNRLIVGAGEPLAIVYQNFSGGALAVLRTTRVRVNYLGIFKIYEKGETKKYNYFAVFYINLTFGELGGSGNIPVVFRNKGITTKEYVFDENSITITVKLDGREEQQTYVGDPTADGSVVIVRVAQVEAATRG